MIFDVMVRSGWNENGKPVISVYRYHDSKLGECLRNIQEAGQYIITVIPLFKPKVIVPFEVPQELVETDDVGESIDW